MNIKEEYFVWEPRLNNVANDDRISEIVVNIGEKRTEGKIDGKYVITVLQSEYEQIKGIVERINAKKYIKQTDERLDREKRNKELNEILKIFEPSESSKRENTAQRKEIKNKPNNKMKNKKFTPKEILKKAVAVVLSGIAVVGAVKGGEYAINEVKDYKDKVATESLQVLKEELNADKIWDDSTELSSSSSEISVSIMGKDGKRYDYEKHSDIDKPSEDEIKNMEVVEAIRIVAQAQDGNVFRSIAADKLIDRINKGEIDLSYAGNREQDKGIEIGE